MSAAPTPTTVWERLTRAVDPVSFEPRLADHVEIKVFRPKRGEAYAIACNPRDLRHYRLTPDEAEILPLLDGTRTVGDVVVERFRESGELEPAAVADVVRQLQSADFLTQPFVDVYASVRRGLARRGARAWRALRDLQVEWHGAGAAVAWAYRTVLRWAFHPVGAVLTWSVALGGIAAFTWIGVTGVEVPAPTLDPPILAALLLAASYAFMVLHELAHASVLVRFGRRVGRAGVSVYLGSPTVFVDTSDSLMLEPRQRVVQSLAGPVAELFVAGAAFIVVALFPDHPVSSVLYRMALLNYLTILMNLVPLLELDAYQALCDWLEVPELRERSLRFVRHELLAHLREHRPLTRQEVGFAIYGAIAYPVTLGAVWLSISFWTETFGGIVSGLLSHGVIGVLLLIGLLLIVGAPFLGGGALGGRALVRTVRGLIERIRLRLQTSWRVDAAELIDALPIMRGLDEDALSDLAARVRLLSVPAGKPVFRQGDAADAFYVVRRGTLHIYDEDPETGVERVIQTVTRGESFGELGLLRRAPRAASVRAVDDVQLYVVDRPTFDLLLARMVDVPQYAATLQLAAEIRGLPPFQHLDSARIADLVDHGAFVSFAPGEELIRQGDVGDAFYVIASGQIDIVRDGAFVRTLGSGSYVGEVALLTDAPRNATVVARTPVRAFRLSRAGFEAVVADAFRRGSLPPAERIERVSRR